MLRIRRGNNVSDCSGVWDGLGILSDKHHSDKIDHRTDEVFHIGNIAIFDFADIVCFIVSDPRGPFGQILDLLVVNVLVYAPRKRLRFNCLIFGRMEMNAEILDKEFQCLPITDAGYFVQIIVFSSKSLVVDLIKLRG